jgi:hypothetical protein
MAAVQLALAPVSVLQDWDAAMVRSMGHRTPSKQPARLWKSRIWLSVSPICINDRLRANRTERALDDTMMEKYRYR